MRTYETPQSISSETRDTLERIDHKSMKSRWGFCEAQAQRAVRGLTLGYLKAGSAGSDGKTENEIEMKHALVSSNVI